MFPGEQSGLDSIVYLKALIPKLCELCENFIRYKTEDTVAKHMLSRGTVTLVGAAALILLKYLTQECLHKVEMSRQFDMALVNTLPEQFCIIRS